MPVKERFDNVVINILTEHNIMCERYILQNKQKLKCIKLPCIVIVSLKVNLNLLSLIKNLNKFETAAKIIQNLANL